MQTYNRIKEMKMKKYLLVLMLLLALFFVYSCGNETDPPDDGIIDYTSAGSFIEEDIILSDLVLKAPEWVYRDYSISYDFFSSHVIISITEDGISISSRKLNGNVSSNEPMFSFEELIGDKSLLAVLLGADDNDTFKISQKYSASSEIYTIIISAVESEKELTFTLKLKNSKVSIFAKGDGDLITKIERKIMTDVKEPNDTSDFAYYINSTEMNSSEDETVNISLTCNQDSCWDAHTRFFTTLEIKEDKFLIDNKDFITYIDEEFEDKGYTIISLGGRIYAINESKTKIVSLNFNLYNGIYITYKIYSSDGSANSLDVGDYSSVMGDNPSPWTLQSTVTVLNCQCQGE